MPGVYRSADGKHQARLTDGDIEDKRQGSHVHVESIGPDGKVIEENSHIYLEDEE